MPQSPGTPLRQAARRMTARCTLSALISQAHSLKRRYCHAHTRAHSQIQPRIASPPSTSIHRVAKETSLKHELRAQRSNWELAGRHRKQSCLGDSCLLECRHAWPRHSDTSQQSTSCPSNSRAEAAHRFGLPGADSIRESGRLPKEEGRNSSRMRDG